MELLLINSVCKQTVVLLNPSFFYFFNLCFDMSHAWANSELWCKKQPLQTTDIERILKAKQKFRELRKL